jgi:hypothetical protein
MKNICRTYKSLERQCDEAMKFLCGFFMNGVDDENSVSRVFRERIEDHGKVRD